MWGVHYLVLLAMEAVPHAILPECFTDAVNCLEGHVFNGADESAVRR
jgi:hypothetical protein